MQENIKSTLKTNPFANEAFIHTQFFCRRCGSQPTNSPSDKDILKSENQLISWANEISDLAVAQGWFFDNQTENVFCSTCAPHIHT